MHWFTNKSCFTYYNLKYWFMYFSQKRVLLDTLRIQPSSHSMGHIVLYSTLLVGHTQHPGYMSISSWPFVSKQLRQDKVFIRPAGISEGAFQLRMGKIWFCKLLLLFKIRSKTDAGMHELECAYVSFLEEYTRQRRKVIFYIWCILCTYIILIWFLFHFSPISVWVNDCQSTVVYECCEQAQVFYDIPASSILGHLPLVPVGETSTIPFDMQRESADFPGAVCDKSQNSGDGCRRVVRWGLDPHLGNKKRYWEYTGRNHVSSLSWRLS